MKNAVIYCRVSTEDQRENGTSLDSQVEACQRYADANGYKVVEVFKESKSGANLDRPMLDQVRDMVRQGVVGAVVFYALDRLSRDETDTLILAREFRNHGCELKCATTSLEDTEQGRLLLSILAAVGRLERASIIERTTRGRRQAMRNGKVLGTPITLYGYTRNGSKLEINEDEAAVVRRVFAWYCDEGLSIGRIVARLHSEGVPTKAGGHWGASTVRNVLTQEAYVGEYWAGKRKRSGTKEKKHQPSEWIGPIAVPPIITRAVYERAQQCIERNKVNNLRNCKTEYLLRGLITCPLCGRRYAGRMTDRKAGRIYYQCSRLNGRVGGDHCDGKPVNGRRAEAKAWQWAVAHLTDRRLMEGLIGVSGATDKAQREREDTDLRSLLKVRAELDEAENQQIDLYSKHAISFEKFMERKSERDERAAAIEARIHEIEERQAARAQAAEDVKSAMQLIDDIQSGLSLPMLAGELSFADRRAVLDALHVKAVATDDGDIRISGFISQDVLTFLGVAGEPAEPGEESDIMFTSSPARV